MSVISIPSIHGDRLNHNLDTLAEIGKLPQGGVRRISFSQEDQLARQLVKNWMAEAGMTTCIDSAGNLIGRYPGRHNLPSLATGSHIDTVPSAGRYDGTLGVLAGIEVVRALKFNNISLNHPIEVIVFTDEENTMIGGKAIAGTHNPDPDYYQEKDGLTIQERLKRVGGNWETIANARRSRDDMAAFVELHVEQGGVLESKKAEIGVVEGVVSMNRYTLTVTGSPNHAGTTPMDMRQDALVAASQIVLTVNQLANYLPGEQVATVGMMNVWPNATNIVPGRVELSLDIRDLYTENVEALVKRLTEQIDAIAQQTGTTIELEPTLNADPTLSSPMIMEAIAQSCEEQKLSHMKLPSRAGHDAQEIGRITDMGMIFVPSQGGISHSEDEFTPPEQCTQGANILMSTLIKLDALYS
ncbi:MAG: Zn-dependent hydrolase [Leptolyngbyaceae bacterium]|nr:Zn-dependent hydrolase [Leptolyngbyaceae bacterium]